MPETILVIDDSPDVHTLVRTRLGKQDIAILSASDGPSGVAAAHEFRPDLILLDIDMPGRDGFETCADLKADSMTSNIPVIFLSGASATLDKIRGLELGATDYVTKPFDPAELRARVQSSLRMRRLVESLAQKAMVDGLTGLWNRTYLETHVTIELVAAKRSGRPLSCVMADIDHFKSINDTYGHGFGDSVIQEVGTILVHNCRADDIVCRYGGEEFTILFPNTALDRAVELAERLRIAVETRSLMCRDTPVRVTCSLGAADVGRDILASIIELADDALYRAKRAGRNRVKRADHLIGESCDKLYF